MKNENKRRYNKRCKGEKKRNILIFKFLNDAIIVPFTIYLFGIISFNFIFIILIIFY